MRKIFAFVIFASAVFMLPSADAAQLKAGIETDQSAQPTDISAHRRRVYRRAYRAYPYYGWTPYWDRTPYDGGYYKLYPYRYWYSTTIFRYGPWW